MFINQSNHYNIRVQKNSAWIRYTIYISIIAALKTKQKIQFIECRRWSSYGELFGEWIGDKGFGIICQPAT